MIWLFVWAGKAKSFTYYLNGSFEFRVGLDSATVPKITSELKSGQKLPKKNLFAPFTKINYKFLNPKA